MMWMVAIHSALVKKTAALGKQSAQIVKPLSLTYHRWMKQSPAESTV
jgi:hypothetical protein